MNNIEDLLEVFRNEVDTAKWSFYAWKSITNIENQDQKIYQALNKNAYSWNIITHSLQTTFLIVLGRILDAKDKNGFTIDSFLDTCIKEIAQFSKVELEKRKRQGWKEATEKELNSYILEAYEPSEQDFSLLKKAAEQHIQRHNDIYKPIRNKLLAHKNKSFLQQSGQLFAKTNINDIEATLLFLHQVNSVVREFLINGRKTMLHDYCLRKDIDLIQNDITEILDNQTLGQ